MFYSLLKCYWNKNMIVILQQIESNGWLKACITFVYVLIVENRRKKNLFPDDTTK